MRMSFVSSKIFALHATVALCLLLGATVPAGAQSHTLRLGVYDSRAVAVAYANSTEFRDAMKAVREELQHAKDAKDDKKVREIESRMKMSQRRLHEQGFSTGSVAGIMTPLKDQISAIARKAGAQAIVSKWELNYQASEIETVDLTNDLVALFHVSDKGREWAKGIQAKPPVPMEQVTDEMD